MTFSRVVAALLSYMALTFALDSLNLVSFDSCSAEDSVATTQSDKESKRDKSDAAMEFVPKDASMVVVIRPAEIMDSDDYRELKKKGGRDFDKIVRRLTNSWFKFGLAKLEDIDSLAFANWMDENGQHQKFESALILKTRESNPDGFEMATHSGKEEVEFKGEKIFVLKKKLNRQYKYAWIADEKTIVWGGSQKSVEAAISTGKSGAHAADWFRNWKPFNDRPISFSTSNLESQLAHAPAPLQPFKKLTTLAGGVVVSRKVTVELKGICNTAKDAKQVVDAATSGLAMANSMLTSQLTTVPQEQKFMLQSVIRMTESAKVKANGKMVEAKAHITIDLDSLLQPISDVYCASNRTAAANNLRQNALGFLNFESAYGKLPSPVMVHESGKKYSWRIAILPFIEQQEIYDRYDFTQDWDSPHNLEVTSEMPDVFRADFDDEDSTNTSFFMLTGPGGVFDGETSLSFAEMSDGTSNTIGAIEAKREVYWSKPEDITIDPNSPMPEFGGFHEGGFNVTMVDGSVRFISQDVAPEVLRKMFTAAGGEVANEEELEPNREAADK